MAFILTIKTAHGYLSATPPSGGDPSVPPMQYRGTAGTYEQFEIDGLDDVVALLTAAANQTLKAPAPTPPVEPLVTPITNYRNWFMGLVDGRPFGPQTLLDLEPTMVAAGVVLTTPNAAGDRTKIGVPESGQHRYFRVGFGEGFWVWVDEGLFP